MIQNFYEEKFGQLTKAQEKNELKKTIAAFANQIYEELKQQKAWMTIGNNLGIFLDNGIDATKIYLEFKNRGNWHIIADKALVFIANGLDVRLLYEDCRNANQWQIIIKNILENAYKFTPH